MAKQLLSSRASSRKRGKATPSVPTKRSALRLSALFSLAALIVLFAEFHWALWYYFDFEFDAQKVLAEVATGGIVGAIYGFLPELNRRYLQRKIRRTVANPITLRLLIALALLIFIVGLALNRTKINLPSEQAEIEVDGKPLVSKNWTERTSGTRSVYAFIFQQRHLQVGDFSQAIEFRPLVPLTYEIPEAAVFSSRPEYQEIVRLLALSFFQSTENRFLSDANDRFTSDAAKKFVDLNASLGILKLCFNGNDTGRSADILLNTFRQERPTSSWLPLLTACVHYAHNEFSHAEADLAIISSAIRSPLHETAVFFRGVNQLKVFIEKANTLGERDLSLLTKAQASFQEAAGLADHATDEFFRKFATGSGRIFEGIAYVYGHDNDRAAQAFRAAATTDYPEIRARSFSDLGYVTLLLGNLPDAQSYFNKALEADPTFPYAQTNLGYVLMAQGRYDAARELFVRLSKDDLIKRISNRDIVLSEIAIAHLDSEKDKGTPNPDAYNDPLKQMSIFNYEGVDPPTLRLAKIRLVLADKIYMSHDYYGLEMLALAMYARAYRDAIALTGNSEAYVVAATALNEFKTVATTVDPRCFIFHVKDGFFKPVADLALSAGVTP
jgi:tetratricopeptide (TPR) repeat protein